MAENKRAGVPVAVRVVLLLLVVGTVTYFVWRSATRTEGYTGGDVTTTGTIDAIHVQLGYKVGGRLASVPVTEGDNVQPGQLVGRMETDDLDVQVQAARATLEGARASLAQARAGLDKAARDLERQRELLSSDATTQQQMDAAKAGADMATAQVRAGDAQVRQAESALAQAELQRSYAELRAPSAGQVSEVIHRPGEMVMVGTPVLALAQVDTVKVRAAVDETRIGAIRIGDGVRVKVYTFDRREFLGEVTEIQPAGDFATRKDWGAERRDIRTFTVIARMPNPEHLLKDGMTAEVTITVSPDVKRMAGARR
jgi:RND family efflux transporter MFP subunit